VLPATVLSTTVPALPTMEVVGGEGMAMGDIGTERREVEFEPLPDRPVPEPRHAPSEPEPRAPAPERT